MLFLGTWINWILLIIQVPDQTLLPSLLTRTGLWVHFGLAVRYIRLGGQCDFFFSSHVQLQRSMHGTDMDWNLFYRSKLMEGSIDLVLEGCKWKDRR